MAPNVRHSWERLYNQRKHSRFQEDDSEELLIEQDILKPSSIQEDDDDPKECVRGLWKTIVGSSTTTSSSNLELLRNASTSMNQDLLDALSSIIVLDDSTKNQQFLELHNATLSNVSSKLLKGLSQHAPAQFSARVADFQENLFYHMQQKRGFDHFQLDDNDGIQQLESFLEANEYLGSFLSTESSLPQPPHVDYTYEVLEEHQEHNTLRIGFFPLTQDGMFLQLWPTMKNQDYDVQVEGQVIFIPYGKVLVVPASTIHGGGFRTSSVQHPYGNLRFHLYIATDGATLPAHQNNKYTEPHDKGRELSRRYVDSRHMPALLNSLFV